MPRQARIDAPGALHHIICRGIEQRNIFNDDVDRENFLDRLGIILKETFTACYGWALMPNHFHLILRTGQVQISAVMRRLLTGYALSFNRRHHRSGHLFQNRFKSVLCQEDIYLKTLVAYIHLNPLRAKIVDHFKDLSRYPYCGHGAILGTQKIQFQDVSYILQAFGTKVPEARRNYREFIRKRINIDHRSELVGGGLIRSIDGWGTVNSMSKARIHQKGDERILGSSDFIRDVLAGQKERLERRYQLKAQGYDIERVVKKVAEIFEMAPEEIWKPGNQPLRVKARSMVCYWAVRELGMSGTSVGQLLGLGQPAVSRAVRRGEKLTQVMNVNLIN